METTFKLAAVSGATIEKTTEVKNPSNEKLLIAENHKLKNVTQQKRVEQIETQKWEIVSLNATIDNLKLEYQAKLDLSVSALENSLEIKNRTIKKQSDELEKLGETCGNLVRTKLRNESAIKDLTKRNGNLKTIANDQAERIEVMQNEHKNYESAIAEVERQNKSHKQLIEEFNTENKWLKNEVNNFNTINRGLVSEIRESKESRERLASKFTNWFIFLVLTNIVSVAWGVYQLLTK